MSDILAHYSFIPWFRQGMSARITEADIYAAEDESGLQLERAQLDIELRVVSESLQDAQAGEHVIRKNLAIYGPGDVVGVSNRVVVRTEPKAGIDNFEANNLAFVEFYEEDLPWRYTPASPGGSGDDASRLRPWIALIVLTDEEFTLHPSTEGMSSISVTQAVVDRAFVPAAETWAWAHVQMSIRLANVAGNDMVTELEGALDADPDSGISRLLCPRKLRKNTAYTAFVVPTFEVGRLGGLDRDTSGLPAQRPAWRHTATGATPAEANLDLPFYYHWAFQTGEHGDFESLVTLLDPIVMDPESGKIPMDVASPGFGLDDMADEPVLGFEGALKPPDFVPDQFLEVPGNADLIARLRKLLNLSADTAADPTGPDNTAGEVEHPFYSSADHAVDDPILTPPIYGMWHALIEKLPPSTPVANPWVQRLNLDLRHRAAAGLGTRTVQAEQERLMDEAWQQVGEINAANERIRQGELANMVNSCIYRKHVVRGDADQFLQMTSSMHNRVLVADAAETVEQTFRASRVPLVAKSAAFKRLVRPTRRLNRTLNALAANTIHQSVLSNFNRDEDAEHAVTAARLKTEPISAMSFLDAEAAIDAGQAVYQNDPVHQTKDAFLNYFDEHQDTALSDRPTWIAQAGAHPSLSADVRTRLIEMFDAVQAVAPRSAGIEVRITAASYEAYFGTNSGSKIYRGVLVRNDDAADTDRVGTATTEAEISAFQSGFAALRNVMNNSTDIEFVAPARRPKIADMAAIGAALRPRLHPQVTMTERLVRQISLWDGTEMRPLDALKPVMAHPEFDDPVYEFLKRQSQDFILPNVEQLPPDSITLLQTNQRFIEAYLAGLNHEMARELLWREFPTDQRGTYFRQFWDVRDNLLETDPEAQYDIVPMHTWQGDLGDNRARTWNEDDPQDDGNIVLVVRGQLLRKYPNTMVYAQRAVYDTDDPTAQRTLSPGDDADVRYPLFSAELEPDIFLFGFDMSIDEARGQRIRAGESVTGATDPGWFFVFKERPGQTKFGLDDFTDDRGDTTGRPSGLETWNDLTWEHLVDANEQLANYVLTFDKSLQPSTPPTNGPLPRWGAHSADLASILFQSPVLFARHADEMLPDED